ncbi:hypothetical protein ABH922_004453 [Rhodococcus sp. 27YEA15]|uniref:hypothetical protein n=1 Tax=Rhodococcus sp. 27YEA15 TaxID=3156259 RepID=UPI003C7CA63F
MSVIDRNERDIRDLLGMHSPAARVMALCFALTCAASAASTSSDVHTVWPSTLAVLICSAAAFTLISSKGDPLPLWQSIALSSTGAATSAAVLSVLPTPIDDPTRLWPWPIGMSTVVLTFMCVRGRTAFAWLGLTAMVVTVTIWLVVTKQNATQAFSLTSLSIGPVLMATMFAYTIRPRSKIIYRLREQSTRRIAAEAAASAALAERDEQLNRLDLLARPLLERVASGIPLTEHERTACALLEAELRDSLRAPGLRRPNLIAAVQAARERGVEVVLLDDHGLDDADVAVRSRLDQAVIRELAGLDTGKVTVRILPPRRDIAATVLVSADEVRRIEFDRVGNQVNPDAVLPDSIARSE